MALVDGAFLHVRRGGSSRSARSGALGMRMSRPSRRTGVGHVPARTSSYAAVRPMLRTSAAVGRSMTAGSCSSCCRFMGAWLSLRHCVRTHGRQRNRRPLPPVGYRLNASGRQEALGRQLPAPSQRSSHPLPAVAQNVRLCRWPDVAELALPCAPPAASGMEDPAIADRLDSFHCSCPSRRLVICFGSNNSREFFTEDVKERVVSRSVVVQ